ncbi:unnamed protein product, partial [Ixodes hexagonus]
AAAATPTRTASSPRPRYAWSEPSMASVTEKRLLVGFDELGIPDWTQVEFLTFSREIRLCSLCGVVSATTAIVSCGHVLCSFCIRDQGDGPVITCPVDKVETTAGKAKFERNNTELIMSLRVACVNRRNGCRLLDTLRDMKAHLKQCEFQAVQCQMCGKKIKLHEVPGHARKDCTRIHKPENTKRIAAPPASQQGAPTATDAAVQRTVPMQQALATQQMTVALQSKKAKEMQVVVPSHMLAPQMFIQRPPEHVATRPDALQHGEVALLQQKVNKVHEDVRRMASKIQGLKDETTQELENFKKEMQMLKSDKGDYGAIVNALTGLRSQMKGNMTVVAEEFDSLKEEMKAYESNLENVGSFKNSVDSKIEDVVKDLESLKGTAEAYSNLSSTITEMKTSIAAIQDMKYVSEFVNDFEQTLVGDIKGSSGDKKKAFTQQVEMLKKCVGVIDELKTTVKHEDMETVVNELRVIKEDLSRYNALYEKMEGITTDLSGLKAAVKDSGDFAKSEPLLSDECRLEFEKCKAEIVLLHEKVCKIVNDVSQLKSNSEAAKDQVPYEEVVTEVCNLKTKMENFDALEDSVQETKEDAFARFTALSMELNEVREKTLKSEEYQTKSEEIEKKVTELETELSELRMTGDNIHRLQVSLQTLNKRFNRKLEELQVTLQASISDKLEKFENPQELADLRSSMEDIKREVQVLNELKEALSPNKDTSREGNLTEIVEEIKTLKTHVNFLNESYTSLHEKMTHLEELDAATENTQGNVKDYHDLKKKFASLSKKVEERLPKAGEK